MSETKQVILPHEWIQYSASNGDTVTRCQWCKAIGGSYASTQPCPIQEPSIPSYVHLSHVAKKGRRRKPWACEACGMIDDRLNDGLQKPCEGKPYDYTKPHPSHEWKDDRKQTTCKKCGAYKHLGSGFMECKPVEIDPIKVDPAKGESFSASMTVPPADAMVSLWPQFVAPPVTGVHFIGASGTGKSTLAKYVSDAYGLKQLPSAARTTLEKFGLKDFSMIKQDVLLYHKYQLAVLDEQFRLEKDGLKEDKPFVADRAFDHLVYASHYGTAGQAVFARMGEYVETLRTRLIFLVRPTAACLKNAIATGDRNEFLDYHEMLRFDGALELLLNIWGLSYVPITMSYARERRKIVDGHLRSHGLKADYTRSAFNGAEGKG